jgi:hypothetical protein
MPPRRFWVELDCLPAGCRLEAWAGDSVSAVNKVSRVFTGARMAWVQREDLGPVVGYTLTAKGPVLSRSNRRKKAAHVTA